MFKFIAEVVKPDVLIWTGDNSPHTIWDNDFEEVVSATANITKLIKNAFKNTKVTVIAAQGNHDSFPANNQEFTKNNSFAVLTNYSSMWEEAGWLEPNESAEF
jgi:sphingomyelin phosphodiesterase